MPRFLRQHVGLRYGLLVGLVGLVQIAVIGVLMFNNRGAVLSLQQAEAAREQCFAQDEIAPNTYVGVESCPQTTMTPSVDALASNISDSYLWSLLALFVLYVLAGRAARLAHGRKRSAAGAAFVAAVVGGAIYIVASTLRTVVLFSPFVVWQPLAIDTFPPYSVGSGDEIGTLLFFLAFLSLFALLLGLLGSVLGSQQAVKARCRGQGHPNAAHSPHHPTPMSQSALGTRPARR